MRVQTFHKLGKHAASKSGEMILILVAKTELVQTKVVIDQYYILQLYYTCMYIGMYV